METQRFSKLFLSANLALALFLQACGGAATGTLGSGDDRVIWSQQSISLDGGTSTALLGASFLTLNATIVPPTGTYADDVYVRGTKAYVSYNTPGATAVGAIDYLNLATATNPVRLATFSSTAADINGVYVDASNNLYAIGGDGVNGSMMYQMGVTGTAFTPVTSTTYLPSFAGTGVKVWGSSLYTLSGNAGGLNIFTPGAQTNNLTPNLAISDARGMDQNGSSNLWTIAGGGNLYEISAAGAILNTVTAAGANNIPESKSAVHVGTSVVAASLGSQGMEMVCMADHKVLVTLPQVTVSGLAATSTVTNSVTFGNGLLFVANGLAGVYVYSIAAPILPNLTGQIIGISTSVCPQLALTLQGKMDLGSASDFSANNVYYSGGVLYVSTGAGGFKVITVNLTLLSILTGLLSAL